MRQIDSGTSAVVATFNALGNGPIGRTVPTFRRAIHTTRRVSFWAGTAPAGGTLRFRSAGACWRSMRTGAPRRCISTTPTPWAGQQWTTAAGGSDGEVLFYPWGAQWGSTTNGYQLFASLLWYDPETDGYQTPNRYYIPRLARWLTPDPMGGDVTNPQSFNRYAYALNNPTSSNDPSGLSSALDPYPRCSPESAFAADVDCTDDPGAYSTDLTNLCSYMDLNDASCRQMAGLWPNDEPLFGGWSGVGIDFGGGDSGGFGSGNPCYDYDCEDAGGGIPGWPNGGDYGPVGPLSLEQLLGLPGVSGGPIGCEFGPCTSDTQYGFTSGGDLAGVVNGLNKLSTPFVNLAVTGGFLVSGVTLIGVGAGVVIVGCNPATWTLTCAASAWGGTHAIAGGVALLYSGYQYTKQVTVPSWGLNNRVVPRH